MVLLKSYCRVFPGGTLPVTNCKTLSLVEVVTFIRTNSCGTNFFYKRLEP